MWIMLKGHVGRVSVFCRAIVLCRFCKPHENQARTRWNPTRETCKPRSDQELTSFHEIFQSDSRQSLKRAQGRHGVWRAQWEGVRCSIRLPIIKPASKSVAAKQRYLENAKHTSVKTRSSHMIDVTRVTLSADSADCAAAGTRCWDSPSPLACVQHKSLHAPTPRGRCHQRGPVMSTAGWGEMQRACSVWLADTRAWSGAACSGKRWLATGTGGRRSARAQQAACGGQQASCPGQAAGAVQQWVEGPKQHMLAPQTADGRQCAAGAGEARAYNRRAAGGVSWASGQGSVQQWAEGLGKGKRTLVPQTADSRQRAAGAGGWRPACAQAACGGQQRRVMGERAGRCAAAMGKRAVVPQTASSRQRVAGAIDWQRARAQAACSGQRPACPERAVCSM
ncbi:hypothetical protein GGX14DRAFT_582140 [Mycena pura]|uniref:Uncharacterized protein n=1 Tax=Mycena pura TaxID=153505 RepID=A0AAD6YUL5_9AGAR|nr:hypothetical protein GGX14DRAFT_582140 [Mycena pura]